MSQTRAMAFNWLLLPMFPLLMMIAVWDIGALESYLLIAYFFVTLLVHLHYGVGVVSYLWFDNKVTNNSNNDVFVKVTLLVIIFCISEPF